MSLSRFPNSLLLNNGLYIPLLGLGTWQSKPGEVERAVELALNSGYRHLDCAALYANETEVGKGIKAAGIKREDIFITSKLWNTKHHPDDVENACKKTLEDLGLQYLDLYLIHWPHALQRGDDPFPRTEAGLPIYDESIHPTDTWLAMEKLVEKDLVKSIGVSNFNSEQIEDILKRGKIKPVTNQVECHPYLNQEPLINFCKERDITVTAYSPLGSPNRPWAKPDDPKLLDDPKLKEIATQHKKTPAQIVLRWQVQRGIITIPKSVTPARIEENGAIFDFRLSDAEMKHINGFDCNGRMVPPLQDGKYRDSVHIHFPFNREF